MIFSSFIGLFSQACFNRFDIFSTLVKCSKARYISKSSVFLSIWPLIEERCHSLCERDAKVEHSFTSLDFCFFICLSTRQFLSSSLCLLLSFSFFLSLLPFVSLSVWFTARWSSASLRFLLYLTSILSPFLAVPGESIPETMRSRLAPLTKTTTLPKERSD